MNPNQTVVVAISVVTKSESDVARAAEVFGRAAAGLALDGISANLNVHMVEDDDDDD